MKKVLFCCLLLVAALSQSDVKIKRNTDEIERIKQHFKTNVPCAKGYLNNDQDDLTNATWTRILLDAESFDVTDNFNITNSSFTVPITGYYQINASVELEATDLVADKSYYCEVRSNGSALFSGFSHASAALALTINCSDIANLTAGDAISLWVMSNSGDNAVDVDSGATTTFLSIRLLQ